MNSNRLNDKGFAHYVLVAAVLASVAIGGTFYAVVKANDSAKSQLTAKQSSATKVSPIASDKTAASSATPVADTSITAAAPAATTSGSSAAKTPTKTTTPVKSSPASPPASPAPAPATETSLSALTTVIANLQNGASANVTASSVAVAGPISTAQARPIVFTANGQTYFAYRQGQALNFNATAAQVASTMAITAASSNSATLTSAHLDKASNLVDPNFQVVGYSTGGN